jgi:stage II sporulation protein M
MKFRYWLFIAVALFAAGIVWGLNTPLDSAPLDENVDSIRKLAEFLSTQARPTAFLLLFLKNVVAVALSFALSPFLLLVPVFALFINGGLLGAVAVAAAQEKSLLFVAAAILPHGILELPAFFIGQAAALSFGVAAMLALVSRSRRAELGGNLRRNLRYLGLSALLLLPAAFIETYITPVLAR